MKKRLLFSLLFLLIIPCFIKADYYDSVNNAAKYKNRIISSAISNYFYNDDYALDGNSVKKVNTNFLSISEFNITSVSNKVYKNGYSYIYDGSKVWTLSPVSGSSHYVISNFKNDYAADSSNNIYIKPTIMINPSKVASGSGSFDDPWVFIEEYDVIFVSEDESIIKLNPTKIKVLSGGSASIKYEVLQKGYSVKDTSCKESVNINTTDNKIYIDNVMKNTECTVYIDAGLYEITLEGNASPNVLYLKYNKGYYKDKKSTKIATKIDVPTQIGYTFGGYRYNGIDFINSSGQIIGSKNLISSDVTLKPIMNAITTAYKYSCSSDITTCTYDHDCYIKESSCNKTGYTHTGWVDQNGKAYIPGENVKNYVNTKGITLTLSPTYTAKTYTLYYDKNGGTLSTDSKTITYDSKYGTLLTPTRTGYTFNGWYTSSVGGTKVNENTIHTIATDVNIYAHWTANTYNVAYNANNGSGSMGNTTCTYDSNCTLRNNTLTRTGYTFLGWSTNSTATSATYNNASSVKNLTTVNNGTATLYAVWKANTYTIKYNANNGSGSMSNTTCTYGSNCTLRSNSFTRSNYTFLGWSTNSTATSATYLNKQVVSNLTSTNGGTINLYAVWKANYICPNGGTLTADSNKGASSGGYVCVVSGEYYEYSYSYGCSTCTGCSRSSRVCDTCGGGCKYTAIPYCTSWGSGVGVVGCGCTPATAGSSSCGCTGSTCCCHEYAYCNGNCPPCVEWYDTYECNCTTTCTSTYQYSCGCSTGWDYDYKCPSGYSSYSGSGSSLKCYKAATAGS